MFKRMVIVLLILLSSSAFANLEIEVISNKGWGSATVSNIQKLCENVAWHFQKHLRAEHKINGELTVVYHTHPAAFYRSSFGGNIDEYKIGLTVTGTAWSQMSYQFGHEFTHILHNFEDTKHPDPNHWFQEGICEVATVWSLIEMSKSWYSNPPYQNWKGYRLNLKSYADRRLNRLEVKYQGTPSEWLQEKESRMRLLRGSYPYAEICQLTYNFLPIFQEHPEAWNAVRQMPVSNSKISDYMQEWYNAVDEQDKVYVEKLANTIDISINRSPINIVTNDNSVNLTFTHKDDFSLTPINTINEWDGWRAGVWEKHPDGNITNKPVQYRGFPESNIWSHWMYAHATSSLSALILWV